MTWKHVLIVAVLIIPASICATIAGKLALANESGWGWFLMAAVILSGISVKTGGDK